MVSAIKEEIYTLSIRVNHMQTELHVLKINTHHFLEQLKKIVETRFAKILIAIQYLAPILAPAGPDPPPNSPPSPPLAD